ncbi:MAG TPA: NlpC/P60 family protein [Eubacteriales bacterium]|nr:NlpC/P60 family protein [Clostridia bacterium]HRV73107.1 NlpC/P60 family protein [Eubacteriales bacterium]
MQRALVKVDVAPLYLKPEVGAERDDEMLYGMTAEILERIDESWLKVRTPYRYESFIESKYLCFDEKELEYYDNFELRLVLRQTADLIDGETMQHPILFMVTRGALLVTLGKDDTWTRVRMIGGKTAFIRNSHLTAYKSQRDVDEDEFRRGVTATAMSYLGTQYRWGGRTPLGIDCSGLCGESYLINGVTIYRNARIEEGFPVHRIAFEDIKPGDLLYFPRHIAMYLGGGYYINSTSAAGSDGVVINSLNEGDPKYREDHAKNILYVGSIF